MKSASIYAIKKYIEAFKERDIINEVCVTDIAYLFNETSFSSIYNSFLWVTELEDEKNYSLVLEYADAGTLEKYLSDNVKTKIKWEIQLKFAKEIAWAVLWLYDSDIIHGDLHPKNILIHQNTADFGCSRLHGPKCYTKPHGIIP
ncbi:hypothetical protein RhiirA4_485274 [Rhizophagus irregularis]|uniref:Protein kinase domain-containing protein n=1 Tax=Rhizophagus irregularis TaxID=588596 RepID=A0A2I1HPY5_9GLOM|nr:hypothetical protein RhiirA4_485274 [Rhizophagus irregularis]